MINLKSGNTTMNLIDLGWNSHFQKQFEPFRTEGLIPARIAQEHKNVYLAIGEKGEYSAEISGKFRYLANGRQEMPAVGDWAAISEREQGKATIQALLPRQSAFVRKEAGQRTAEQVVAANIDVVFIVSGLDGNFNVNRIERYLTLTYESGALPVILLNKSDLCDDLDSIIDKVESRAIGIPVLALSAACGQGLDGLLAHLEAGKTAAFLGSSGVGKSSIINRLLGEDRLAVKALRENDSRGRHTTTHRELIVLPKGGIVIDTPGMRELQVWGDDQGLKEVFDDIEELAANCRFRDCGHHKEPGCAVRAAVDEGNLEAARFQSYQKLRKEIRYLEARQVLKANVAEKLKWKQISKIQKRLKQPKKSK
jgi:ribosome biogenesis GTPase / thiamine phosphate phosphatase